MLIRKTFQSAGRAICPADLGLSRAMINPGFCNPHPAPFGATLPQGRARIRRQLTRGVEPKDAAIIRVPLSFFLQSLFTSGASRTFHAERSEVFHCPPTGGQFHSRRGANFTASAVRREALLPSSGFSAGMEIQLPAQDLPLSRRGGRLGCGVHSGASDAHKYLSLLIVISFLLYVPPE